MLLADTTGRTSVNFVVVLGRSASVILLWIAVGPLLRPKPN